VRARFSARHVMFLGSARLWRAGERHQAFANFSLERSLCMETRLMGISLGRNAATSTRNTCAAQSCAGATAPGKRAAVRTLIWYCSLIVSWGCRRAASPLKEGERMKVRGSNSNCQLARVSEPIALHRPLPSPLPGQGRGDLYARRTLRWSEPAD